MDNARGRARIRGTIATGLCALGLLGVGTLTAGSACAESGVAQATLVSVYDVLADRSTGGAQGLPALFEAGVRLARAASVAEAEGETAVAGARDPGGDRPSGSAEPEEDGPVSSAGPSLADPFGDAGLALDNPFFLILMAIVVACLASAAREIRRAVR